MVVGSDQVFDFKLYSNDDDDDIKFFLALIIIIQVYVCNIVIFNIIII